VGVSSDCRIFWVPPLSQERIKLRTSNFVATFIGSIQTKAHENAGNSSRGRSQGVSKIFRALMYMAHCAVIFAIAQLSCTVCSVLSKMHRSTDRQWTSNFFSSILFDSRIAQLWWVLGSRDGGRGRMRCKSFLKTA